MVKKTTFHFTDYDQYQWAILSAVEAYRSFTGMDPNLLFASAGTFFKLQDAMAEFHECLVEDDNPDAGPDLLFRAFGITSPRYRDSDLEMGGYICKEFALAFGLDENIAVDEFYLDYIPWQTGPR